MLLILLYTLPVVLQVLPYATCLLQDKLKELYTSADDRVSYHFHLWMREFQLK